METPAWDEAPLPPPGTLLPGLVPLSQHPAYGRACRRWGREVRWFRLGQTATPTATALVLERRWPVLGSAALLSRGPVWHRKIDQVSRRAAEAALLARLRLQYRAVIVHPEVDEAPDLSGAAPLLTPPTVAEWMLDRPADTLRRELAGTWRTGLRRAMAAGVEVRLAPFLPDPDHWLLAAETAQARARGYRGLPTAFTTAWATVAPAQMLLAEARLEERLIAGQLFLLHAPAASYHIGWSGMDGRRTEAHRLLLWQVALHLQGAGIRRLDLGLLDTETAPGLARFKLGTGALPRTLGRGWLAAPLTGLVGALVPDRGAAAA